MHIYITTQKQTKQNISANCNTGKDEEFFVCLPSPGGYATRDSRARPEPQGQASGDPVPCSQRTPSRDAPSRSAPCLRRYRRSAGDGPKGQGRENAAPKRLTRRAERGEQDNSATRAQRRGHLTRPEPAAALHLPTLDTRGRRGSTRQPGRNQPPAEAGRCWLPPSCGRGTTNPSRLRGRTELPAGAGVQPGGTPHRPTSTTLCGSPGARSVGGALRWRREKDTIAVTVLANVLGCLHFFPTLPQTSSVKPGSMSCLDCSCILRTPVESLRPEKQSQSSIHECLADSEQAWIPPSTGGNEMIFCSSNVSHYELQVEIGRRFNNLTSVYLARHTPTGMQVAIRITDLESCSEEHLKALQNEVVLSHFFQHPNVMTFWTVFTAGSWLWIISPFMAYGSARHLLKTYFPEGMSEALIGNILFGAIRGLNYMHQNGYIHRNIKASHILISGDGLVSLSGLNNLYSLVNNGQKSKVVYDFPQFSTSVLPWLSPELLRQDLSGYNMKSDIYSVGITACELANGHVPFQDMPRTQMLLQKLKGPAYCPWDINTFPHGESRMRNSRSGVDSGIGDSMTRTMTSERLKIPFSKTFSPAFHNLVELCLQQDPEKRPSASSLLSHTFFKQIKEQTQSSLLSLLPPPIQNSRSGLLALPSAAAGTELGYITTNQHETDWEF